MAKVKKTNKATASTVNVQTKRLMERIATELKHELVSVNIPTFKSIAQDKDLLTHYFQNRKLFVNLLGENISFLDRVVRSSMATILAKDMIATAINKEGAVYPGLWDEFHIKSLMMTMISVVELADHDGATVLSAHRHKEAPTLEEMKGYPEGTWMSFEAYTPSRLYVFSLVIHQTVLSTIISNIGSVVPAVMFTASGEPVERRYGRQFSKYVLDNIDATEEGTSMDDEADHYIREFEKPLMVYITNLLTESGFSPDAITSAIDKSKASAVYSTENRGGKKATTFVHPWTKIRYLLAAEGQSAAAEFCPMDIKIAGEAESRTQTVTDNDTGEEKVVPAEFSQNETNAANRVGKAMMNFLDSMSVYIINLAINSANQQTADEIAALNAAMAEAEVEATSEI